jgi:acetyltransferase-like isoleucine patch superfamily enzyme
MVGLVVWFSQIQNGNSMVKLLKKIRCKFFKVSKTKFCLNNSISYKIGTIRLGDESSPDRILLDQAFSLLNRDHHINDLGYLYDSRFSNNDLSELQLLFIIGSRSKVSKQILTLLKNRKIPIAFVSTDATSEKLNFHHFDLVFLRDFNSLKKLSKTAIHLHGLAIDENESFFYNSDYFYSQLRTGINLLKKSQTKASNRINSQPNLKVGFNSFHNGNFTVNGNVTAEVGSFCSIGKNVALYTVNHDTRFATTQGFLYREYFDAVHPGAATGNYSRSRSKGPITIKNDVWIGDNVKIMSGVTIGNGACIGAGAVVTKNVGDYEIVGGVPARQLSQRYDSDTIKKLLSIEWWDWSDAKIIKNSRFFNTDLSLFKDIHSLIE